MNEFLQSLGQLNNFLGQEVQRIKAQTQKDTENAVTSSIAGHFLGLNENASESDIRKLSLETIREAAATNTLDHNLPIISALTNDRLQAADRRKEVIQDAMLYSTVSKQYGSMGTTSAIGGKNLANLVGMQRQATDWKREENKAGQVFERKFVNGAPTDQTVLVKATTNAEEIDLKIAGAYAQEAALWPLKQKEMAYQAALSYGNQEALMIKRGEIAGKDGTLQGLRSKGLIYGKAIDEIRGTMKGEAGGVLDQMIAAGVLSNRDLNDPSTGKRLPGIDDVTYLGDLLKTGKLEKLLNNEKIVDADRNALKARATAMQPDYERLRLYQETVKQVADKSVMYDTFGLQPKEVNQYYDVVKEGLRLNDSNTKDMKRYVAALYKQKTGKDYNKDIKDTDFDNLNDLEKGYYFSYIKKRSNQK